MIAKVFSALLGASVGMLAVGGIAIAPAISQGADALSDGDAAKCAGLTGVQVGGAKITKAEFVASGATLPPFADKTSAAFCRVGAVAEAVPGSSVRLQMWLPTQWNGKFVGVGGGGFEGGFASAPLGLRAPVAAGYAALATDAGHPAAADPAWAIGHPEKVVDYGYRANHLGAMFGKALVERYYGTAAKRSYFSGCSNGGRDALMLAQRYPQDYDAIAAGAPANDFTGLMTSFVRAGKLSLAPGVDLSSAKLKVLHDAVVAKCDMNDGIKDGLIGSPKSCRFDPAVVDCKVGGGANCLTTAEVGAVRSIYRGTFTRSGREITPGLPVGSEYNWAEWLTAPKAAGVNMGRQFFGYFVTGDPAWNASAFDLDADYALARSRVGSIIDARNPDLRAFLKRGGKLLMYHGWDDAAIPAGNSVNYYEAMRRASGARAASQTRLFMLPGVSHCTGGNGASAVDYVAELDRWSERGVAPDRLSMSKPESVYRAMAGLPTKVLRRSTVCAFPRSAYYRGVGSSDDSDGYVCR